jgi:hypothetical protein
MESDMEKERLPEAWIGEVVSLGLGEGVSVSGRLEAVNDRGVVVHVSPAYHTHEPARYMFCPWTRITAIEYVEKA